MKLDINDSKLNTREDYLNLATKIISPLIPYYSKGCARLHLGETFAHYDIGATYMEAFSRPLWALVPMWNGDKDDTLNEFARIYRTGLINGTDPKSEEYWGECTSFDQRFVEMAAIAYAVMFAREIIWDPLSDIEKSNLAEYLNKINKHPLPVCNWILFAVLVNIALRSVGYPYDEKMLNEYLDGLEKFYIDEGWYMDGDSGQKDYYISFAIHFYCLIYSKVMEDSDEKRSKLYKERAMLFSKQFIYWFDKDGDAIPFGRSTTYRFSQVSFFSACLIAGIEPFPVSVMKGLIERHLRSWLKRDIFDRDGILTIGYGYPNLMISERYNAPGSPYWGLKVFAFLMLPKDHDFWKVKAQDYPEELLQKPMCPQKSADMILYNFGNHTCAYTPGVYSPRGHGHIVEKYGKFAYDSKFSVSMSRSQYEMCEAVPDNMLAFVIDGYVYVRRICVEHEILSDRVISVWSPYKGIKVKTTILPTGDGHIRIHEIESDRDVTAYDCGFSVRRDDFETVNTVISDENNVSNVSNKYCGCEVRGNIVEGISKEPSAKSFIADPDTNLMYQKTAVPAVIYEIPKGKSTIKTEIKCWWND